MFSQTVEYALRAMMYLAGLDGEPVTSERIAGSTRVPPRYLSKVMRDLVRGGLVDSYRGRGGGFVLAAPPAEITILDVVSSVEPIQRIHKCPLDNPDHSQLCPLHRRLDDALGQIECSLRQTTLAQMLSVEDGPGDTRCDSLGSGAVRPSPSGADTTSAGLNPRLRTRRAS